ncbi:hypothetical protein K439DRAFT_1394438 [Ramaria rubella]|nr:hypothetical protein K439DRAFT_1399113 [Ramaria rubella]KAF8579692.1 hypothetical protein K439DRAFT_1394438 [Ramaria rubella]
MSTGESPHNSHLLFIGQQCHATQCYMVDFLPFRCDHCKHAFCADHYKPTSHECEKYDAAKLDRIAPPCPLCNTPVAIPQDQDPNVRMEQHIERECNVTTGKRAKTGGMPVCARGKCGKLLFAPIKCNSCSRQFCASHRFPSSHSCSAAAASSSTPGSKQAPSSRASATAASNAGTNFVNQTSAASAAAMAAIKRNMATTNKPKPVPKSVAGASTAKPNIGTPTSGTSRAETGSHKHNPFSKTDRPSFSALAIASDSLSSTQPQPLPSPTNRDRCKPLDEIFTTSWAPPSLFGTA